MATKPKKTTPAVPTPDTQALRDPATLEVPKNDHESIGDAMARTVLRPTVQSALTVSLFSAMASEKITLMGLVNALSDQAKAVQSGDIQRAETMLIAQAHSLDAIFNNLARRAHANMGEYLNAAETYLRLALKAQSQCRATLETLALVKNPPNVAFVRQANIANGPQQVNNSVSAESQASRTRETENLQNKLLEAQHGERMDTGTAGAAIGVDSVLETVDAINRPENRKG